MLDLAAFYAPRGISPDEVKRMSLTDRAVLRAGRARWYEEMQALSALGIASLLPAGEDGVNGEK